MRIQSGFQGNGLALLALTLLCCGNLGCTNLCFRIRATESRLIGPDEKPVSRNAYVPIDLAQLTRPPVDRHRLAPGDTLAILLPGIEKDPTEPLTMADFPVVNLDSQGTLPPVVGLPVPILEDGTIRLPLIAPLNVNNLTIEEASDRVKQAYVDAEITTAGKFHPVVSLLKPRTYTVTVIREDTANLVSNDNQRLSTSEVIELPAYQNYLLNALVRTGGLPGLTARPQVRIVHQRPLNHPSPSDLGATIEQDRGMIEVVREADFLSEDRLIQECIVQDNQQSCNPYETVIPLRVPAGTCPQISPESITLQDGDIVYVESREAEVFYTGGMIPGGQHLLPRDYDIDIFEAMAIAGYSYGSSQQNGGGNLGIQAVTGVVPTDLYIFRKVSPGCEKTILVDLEEAANCQSERLIVQAGDKLLLRYSSKEEGLNFGLFTFFTFGLRELLR